MNRRAGGRTPALIERYVKFCPRHAARPPFDQPAREIDDGTVHLARLPAPKK
jgi:hypothetical protein